MGRFAIILCLFGLVTSVGAADPDSPTGTWRWEYKSQTIESESILKLDWKDGKLTGILTTNAKSLDETKKIRPTPPTKIENGKFEKAELSFTVSNTAGPNTVVTKYSGKIEGDTIKGFRTSLTGKKFDWEAKRVVEKKGKD